jgi:hypothetical protein
MSAIFNFCRYACHVTTACHAIFYLDNPSQTILYLPFEISRSLKTFKIYQSIFGQQRILLYGNPCCDVTKTTVNEIKKLSKMADISLLQVKIFQELNNI